MAMQIDKPNMIRANDEAGSIAMAPHMQLATSLIGQTRHAGGNMFRHQTPWHPHRLRLY